MRTTTSSMTSIATIRTSVCARGRDEERQVVRRERVRRFPPLASPSYVLVSCLILLAPLRVSMAEAKQEQDCGAERAALRCRQCFPLLDDIEMKRLSGPSHHAFLCRPAISRRLCYFGKPAEQKSLMEATAAGRRKGEARARQQFRLKDDSAPAIVRIPWLNKRSKAGARFVISMTSESHCLMGSDPHGGLENAPTWNPGRSSQYSSV